MNNTPPHFTWRPIGVILQVQANVAITYARLGRGEQALCTLRDVYSGSIELYGEEHEHTILAASNYAASLKEENSYEEVKQLLRKMIPVAQRVLEENHFLRLRMPKIYARALYEDPGATLGDLREAVTALEDLEQTARRVLGGAHPLTENVEFDLREARAALRARETQSPSN